MARRILSVFGTRPEAIKLAPVVLALGEDPDFASRVCVTGQHREMLDQVLEVFGIAPDIDLDLMRPDQDQAELAARVLEGTSAVLRDERPDLVLVQGDTTSCLAAALAGFYAGIPVGHVEAGLRTGDLASPFPEEGNRGLVGRIAACHFAPTERARHHLLAENVPPERIFVTGNTVIDALLRVHGDLPRFPAGRWRDAFGPELHGRLTDGAGRRLLITGHRRENFGERFFSLCQAIHDLALGHPDWTFVYPVHLNPRARAPAQAILSDLANVFLIEPLPYLEFVWLMDRAHLVLTDSGGIQEEAPSLGKPVLVMRDVTERPEAVEAGTVLLVGTERSRIVETVERVLGDAELYEKMATAHNPYGDGHATARILEVLKAHLTPAAAERSDRTAVG